MHLFSINSILLKSAMIFSTRILQIKTATRFNSGIALLSVCDKLFPEKNEQTLSSAES